MANYERAPFRGKRGKTITVGSSGCDCTTVTAAIAAASSGDTVQIYPGTYSEKITLAAGVDLVGVDSKLCNISNTADYDPTLILADGCAVKNLTITGKAPATNGHHHIVTATGVENANIEHCNIVGGNFSVRAENSAACSNIRLFRNYLEAPNPVWIEYGDSVDILYCDMYYNGATDNGGCLGPVDLTGGTNTTNCKIVGCNAHLTGTGYTTHCYGVSLGGDGGHIVSGNTFIVTGNRARTWCVKVQDGPGTKTPNYITNNTIITHTTCELGVEPEVLLEWISLVHLLEEAVGTTAPSYFMNNVFQATSLNTPPDKKIIKVVETLGVDTTVYMDLQSAGYDTATWGFDSSTSLTKTLLANRANLD